MPRTLRLFILVCLLAACQPAQAPTKAITPPPEALPVEVDTIAGILFESDRDGDAEIFAINPNGAGLTQITNNQWPDLRPAWSRDGQWIAYLDGQKYETTRAYSLRVMRLDGSDATDLGTTNYESQPSWASDGSWLLFVDEGEDNLGDLFRISTTNGSSENITNSIGAIEIRPAWSPDDHQIAFDCTALSADNWDICVADNVEGLPNKNITNHPAMDNAPSWSPDGLQVLFHSNRDGNFEIYLMELASRYPIRLTNSPGEDLFPSMSPDGTRIAFMSDRDGDYEIYIMNRDGTGLVQLTDNQYFDGFPDWKP